MRIALATLLAVACGGSGAIDRHRFINQPPVAAVNDRRDVPKKPAKLEIPQTVQNWDSLVHDPIVRATALPAHRRARGVNALGEVPDSAWFTNRLDGLPPEALVDGPNSSGGPMAAKPWTITSSKTTGAAPGFIIKDANGAKYILKFDVLGYPEFESATDIVLQRLLWALGYYVPEDYVVFLEARDLVVAPDAEVKDLFGNKRPMKPRDVADVLARAHQVDGKMRALASKYVPGIPIGVIPETGTRPDDPNDLIPHEDRRDLRGLEPVAAWLKHTDMKPNNTLDAWIEDPERPGVHYVRHYLIDFGKALGVMGSQALWRSDGYAHWIDFGEIAASLLTLGVRKRPWDGIAIPDLPGVGVLETERYDPGGFEERIPWGPFIEADRFDKFWGAKRLMRLTRAHIEAAVQAGQYSDPRSRRFVADALIARQRKTARYWFNRVNPLDNFAAGDGSLCFDDLSRLHRLEPPAILDNTDYTARGYNYDGAATGWSAIGRVGERGRVCLAGVAPSGSKDGYTIVAIETRRPGAKLGPVLVHLARPAGGGALRVIGVRRL